uniref:Uncharacterized protein n=1 Tax=Anopheles coluzzii TaxID=1518534 RepID=A0A8W7PC70_ANOCL
MAREEGVEKTHFTKLKLGSLVPSERSVSTALSRCHSCWMLLRAFARNRSGFPDISSSLSATGCEAFYSILPVPTERAPASRCRMSTANGRASARVHAPRSDEKNRNPDRRSRQGDWSNA